MFLQTISFNLHIFDTRLSNHMEKFNTGILNENEICVSKVINSLVELDISWANLASPVRQDIYRKKLLKAR